MESTMLLTNKPNIGCVQLVATCDHKSRCHKIPHARPLGEHKCYSATKCSLLGLFDIMQIHVLFCFPSREKLTTQ